MLRLRFDDFTRASRSRTLARATAATDSILFVARALLRARAPLVERRGVTLVGITISGSSATAGSSRCRSTATTPARSTRRSTSVRERFGTSAITRATLLGSTDPGLTPYLEPGEGG